MLDKEELSDKDLFAARSLAKQVSSIKIDKEEDDEEIVFTGDKIVFEKLKIGDVVFSKKLNVQVKIADIRSKTRIRVKCGGITTEVTADDLYYSVAEKNQKAPNFFKAKTAEKRAEQSCTAEGQLCTARNFGGLKISPLLQRRSPGNDPKYTPR